MPLEYPKGTPVAYARRLSTPCHACFAERYVQRKIYNQDFCKGRCGIERMSYTNEVHTTRAKEKPVYNILLPKCSYFQYLYTVDRIQC
jgi:hypothetical protein